MKPNKITVSFFALCHGLVDFASALVTYNAAIIHHLPPATALHLTIIYDVLAFALQPFAGFLIDAVKGARAVVPVGIILVLTGVTLMPAHALAGVVLTGLGNALFHLGAGAQLLSRYPETTTPIGIFVGPGALGLSIGLWFGNQGFFPFPILITSLAAAGIGCALLPALKASPTRHENTFCQSAFQPRVLLLLFVAIVLRGFIGRTGFSGLPSGALTTIGLGAAACIGKMSGGIIADRLGWSRTTVAGLFAAGCGLAFGHNYLGAAFTTMLFFQMTMPITLVAASAVLPGKPAFAFGITCLALVAGTLPAFYAPQFCSKTPFTLTLIGLCGICIIVALRQLKSLTGSRNRGTSTFYTTKAPCR